MRTPVAIAAWLSIVSVVPNAQHDPHPPWFFTGLITVGVEFRQSYDVGRALNCSGAISSFLARTRRFKFPFT